MARPRKPIEQKKLEGTYRKDRDLKNEIQEKTVASIDGVIIPKETKLTCPKTITDKYVRSYWKRLTTNLINLQVLSFNDIPQLEFMLQTLEKLRQAQIELQSCSLDDEEAIERYEQVLKITSKLSTIFNDLASKYYISPQARSKLTLDVLTIQKTAAEIDKQKSGLDAVLALRK